MTFPWWLKVTIKLILSRLPISYRLFARLGIFRHGKMDNAEYAYSVFRMHHSFASVDRPWVGAEIGPGDSVFSAYLAKINGSVKFWLIDSGNFSDTSLDRYRQMEISLKNAGVLDNKHSPLTNCRDFDNLLDNCDARYLTNGVDSLANIPDESIDFLWSHAVLEHIRAARFSDFCNEMHRIIKPGGCASHVVDFKDHLSGGLNNLRFSSKLWEKHWFALNSGFYTNRIRPDAMFQHFEKAGFEVQVISKKTWSISPISRSNLSAEFKDLDDLDLIISGMHFLLKK